MGTNDINYLSQLTGKSIWSVLEENFYFPLLKANLHVDVAIIGAGITGITAALFLARAGLKVAVLEQNKVAKGTTGHSTGNLYIPVDVSMHKLQKSWGEDKLPMVLQSRRQALELIQTNIFDYRLNCDFAREPWVLYTSTGSAEEAEYIEDEYQTACSVGLNCRITKQLSLPFNIAKALVIDHQAQFHPQKYVLQLARAIQSNSCGIFEQAPVIEIDAEAGLIKTTTYEVRAECIIMATHVPKGFNIVQTELGPYREYAVAAQLKKILLPGGIYWSIGTEKHSTRLVNLNGRPYVLTIGEKHKTGQAVQSEELYHRLESYLRYQFNIESIDFRWSAQHYRSADGLPYIGLSAGSSRLYIACGFATDGLIYGTLAAKIISDEITGKKNEFSNLYSPRRFTPVKSAKNFTKENLNVAGQYLKDYLKGAAAQTLAAVPPGKGKLVEIKGDKLAVYRDENNQLHILSAVCTHLKCIVHWNAAECSWDCPCHGSRFSFEGEVLEGPALKPLQRIN